MTGINNLPIKTAARYNAAKCFCIPVLFPRMQLTIIMFIEVPISCQLEKENLVSLLCIHRALVMKHFLSKWTEVLTKTGPFHSTLSFKWLCQECAPCHPVTWCAHSHSPTLLFSLCCLRGHAHKHIPTCAWPHKHPLPPDALANTCQLAESNKWLSC